MRKRAWLIMLSTMCAIAFCLPRSLESLMFNDESMGGDQTESLNNSFVSLLNRILGEMLGNYIINSAAVERAETGQEDGLSLKDPSGEKTLLIARGHQIKINSDERKLFFSKIQFRSQHYCCKRYQLQGVLYKTYKNRF